MSSVKTIWDDESCKVIDCADKTLGKVTQQACTIVRGLDSVDFHPSMVKLQGSCVKLINVSKLKPIDPYRKVYSHTRYGNGFKVVFAHELLSKDPIRYVKKVIKGQLPKNHTQRYLLKRIRVYP